MRTCAHALHRSLSPSLKRLQTSSLGKSAGNPSSIICRCYHHFPLDDQVFLSKLRLGFLTEYSRQFRRIRRIVGEWNVCLMNPLVDQHKPPGEVVFRCPRKRRCWLTTLERLSIRFLNQRTTFLTSWPRLQHFDKTSSSRCPSLTPCAIPRHGSTNYGVSLRCIVWSKTSKTRKMPSVLAMQNWLIPMIYRVRPVRNYPRRIAINE